MPAVAYELQMNTCHNFNVFCTQQVSLKQGICDNDFKRGFPIGVDGSEFATEALQFVKFDTSHFAELFLYEGKYITDPGSQHLRSRMRT